jgi:hypothetical protein
MKYVIVLLKNYWKLHYEILYKNQFQNYFERNYFFVEIENENIAKTNDENVDVFTRLICDSRRDTQKFNAISFDYDTKIHNYFFVSILSMNKKTSNILEYWKIFEIQFLIMTRMIKNVLTISCFDVDVERLFNLTRDVITYRRNWLNSDIIETIMMIKYNLNNCQDRQLDRIGLLSNWC